MPIRIIRGDYLNDGYLADLVPRTLCVLVEDGKAWVAENPYDTNPIGKAHGDPPLRVTEDGDLEISYGTSFCPDPGELARCGLLPASA